MKKALALMLAGAMSAGLLAGCGSAQGTASGSTAATGENGTSAAAGSGDLTMSWWGGDSRHEAYQNALAAFTEETGISVATHYGAWSGWKTRPALRCTPATPRT